MKRVILLSALLLAAACPAGAEQIPVGGSADIRVKYVDYNEKDVVRLVGHYGFSTHIQLAQGEAVESVAMGDSLAWEVAPRGNHLFVKPREPNATTNMSVVTTPGNRVYNFVLTAHQSQNGARPSPNDMYFQVTFRYPEDERKARLAAQNAARTRAMLEHVPVEGRNYNYWGCGSRDLAPTEVMDDGRFTYMRFTANRDMPAVFEEIKRGKEALINTTVEGDWIIVHRVVKRLILRRGPLVTCIENRSFDPVGISTPSATVSPSVERAVRGEN